MKVTFTIKDITDWGYNQIETAENDEARFNHLKKWAIGDLRHCVKMKVGNGSFGDKVDLNGLIRRGGVVRSYKLEPRRGYKLATFEWGRA